MARFSLSLEKKASRSQNKAHGGDTLTKIKMAEEGVGGVTAFDVFLALNRRAIG